MSFIVCSSRISDLVHCILPLMPNHPSFWMCSEVLISLSALPLLSLLHGILKLSRDFPIRVVSKHKVPTKKCLVFRDWHERIGWSTWLYRLSLESSAGRLQPPADLNKINSQGPYPIPPDQSSSCGSRIHSQQTIPSDLPNLEEWLWGRGWWPGDQIRKSKDWNLPMLFLP